MSSIIIYTYIERDNIVDDNSPDNTGRLADDLTNRYKNISVIRRSVKKGLGTAYIIINKVNY